MRAIAIALLAGLTAVGVTAGVAAPAAQASAAGRAPSCLAYKLDDRGAQDELWVWNNCKKAVNFRVRLANGPDSYCTYKEPRSTYSKFTWEWPQRFDGLVTC
ncbi:hypothetical protein ACIBO5_38370 [Nonomuraea angiospora]|uniref:hypothetical protein n=1 Tax=Nonomuraea angiospora TaxID=46172 RepID=UPI0029B42641|nr:hypothetical protein [Nonomuraea angiospora]MDX3106884.1 hypothetical protein [Nonomuraea angiospora]